MTVLENEATTDEMIPDWINERIDELNHNDLMKSGKNLIGVEAFQSSAEMLNILGKSESRKFYSARDLKFFVSINRAFDNFLETFQKLSLVQRDSILDGISEFRSDELASFVFALNISKATGNKLLYQDLSNFEEFHQSFKVWGDSYQDRWGYNFDPLDFYSKAFERVAMGSITANGRYRMGRITLMFLLREMYGEHRVLEVMNRREIEAPNISMIDVLKLLQDWDEWESYPISWSVTVVDDNLQRPLDLSNEASF